LRRARVAGYQLRHCWRIPVLVAVKDLSQIVGMLVGILDAVRARRRGPDVAG
jgi:hypothetical protein